jgi:hypothetical protein
MGIFPNSSAAPQIISEHIKNIFDNFAVVKVKFQKVSDSTVREMICTRDTEIIKQLIGTDISTDKIDWSHNQIHVYSLEDKGWRSFLSTLVVDIQGV